MVFRKYYINIYIRVLLLLITCLALGWLVAADGHFLITIHVFLLVILQAWLMVRYTNNWNSGLSDFFSRLQADDWLTTSRSFSMFPNLKTLENNLNALAERIRKDKKKHEIENEYFKILSQKVATGIIVCDENGDVQYTNPAALHYFGLPAIRNINTLDRHHPGASRFFQDLAIGDYGSLNISLEANDMILMIRASELVRDQERLKVYSIEDIEREIKKHELESWQKLIRILNHEIMNSISPITSTVHTLGDSWKDVKGSDEPEQKLIGKTLKGLQIIQERSEGLKSFVEAYRSLTKMPEPSLKMVSPGTVLLNIKELFGKTILDANINLKISYSESIIPIETDQNLLQQALINLVKNSIESFDKDQNHPEIKIYCKQHKTQTLFSIEDNGKGMSEETLKNATIPFFTTKPEGTGIGLSLVRQLISVLNGEMKLMSKSGHGTRVMISLPGPTRSGLK